MHSINKGGLKGGPGPTPASPELLEGGAARGEHPPKEIYDMNKSITG